MNERINELAEQATSIVESPKNSYGWGSSYAYFDKQRFAELIVQECIKIVENSEIEVCYDSGLYPVCLTVNELREHFGVMESEE